jgi:tetratricopeptide (TPR) repeat protein
MREGNFEGAIEHYQRAVELQPHCVQAVNNLTYLLADKANKLDEALGYAQQAVATPEDADVIGTLGWVLYREGLYHDAQRHLQRVATQG